MAKVAFGSKHDAAIDAHATASAKRMNRGSANIEDQLRSAITLLEGLEVIDTTGAERLKKAIDKQMSTFLTSLLKIERGIATGRDADSSKDRDEVYRKARELKPVHSAILFFGHLPKDAAIVL